ncbi:MAG: hypothetical protein ACPLW9_01730 [Minisyncoccales bacterium]
MNQMVNISGKGMIEYIAECLSEFNRGTNSLIVRGVGRETNKTIEVVHFLCKKFGIEIEKIEMKPIKFKMDYKAIETCCLEATLKPPNSVSVNPQDKQDKQTYNPLGAHFVDFPVYQLLLDNWLAQKKQLIICDKDSIPLITIKENSDRAIVYEREVENPKRGERDFRFEGVQDIFYRSSLLFPSNWKEIIEKFKGLDDLILGVDTNILYNCTISEHLFPLFSVVNSQEFFYTPNWLLIVIPSAVMHELEEAANIRDNQGYLQLEGRKAFRALQEIIELNQSAEIAGVSLLIVGEANPILDTRVELQGLREDFYRQIRNETQSGPIRHLGLRKRSSGDMIIRDQFKRFLQQINFHKGSFFLTADKSSTALARAEGLHPIYISFPFKRFVDSKELSLFCFPMGIRVNMPIGNLIYEAAVQFGTIKIKEKDESKEVEIECDNKGDNLDHWLFRQLRISDQGLFYLCQNYQGNFALQSVAENCHELWRNLIE